MSSRNVRSLYERSAQCAHWSKFSCQSLSLVGVCHLTGDKQFSVLIPPSVSAPAPITVLRSKRSVFSTTFH